MDNKLLQQLALAVAANETAQRKFRNAVLIRLAKIDTVVTMIHGAQIVEAHKSNPGYEDKMKKHAMEAEKEIAQQSKELGLKMVEYIYEASEPPPAKRKQRRKRSA